MHTSVDLCHFKNVNVTPRNVFTEPRRESRRTDVPEKRFNTEQLEPSETGHL